MITCKHFNIEELVDPLTFERYGDKSWQFLDKKILKAIDLLRDRFGPATVNDWSWGGKFKWSGLRTQNCRIGAKMSQHKFGRAMDLKFKNYSPIEVRKEIRSDLSYWSKYINCIENKTKTWVHVDVRNFNSIKFINP